MNAFRTLRRAAAVAAVAFGFASAADASIQFDFTGSVNYQSDAMGYAFGNAGGKYGTFTASISFDEALLGGSVLPAPYGTIAALEGISFQFGTQTLTYTAPCYFAVECGPIASNDVALPVTLDSDGNVLPVPSTMDLRGLFFIRDVGLSNGLTAKGFLFSNTIGVPGLPSIDEHGMPVWDDILTGGWGAVLTNAGFITIKDVTLATIAPGVPEPATWLMMIMGFGLTGFAVRRRRAALAV